MAKRQAHENPHIPETDLAPRTPGTRGSGASLTRRFNRGLAAAARAGCDEERCVELLLTWLQGYVPRLVKDSRARDGWRITTEDADGIKTRATPEQMMWAWTQLRQAGWGMPANTLHLDADVRAQAASQGALGPSEVAALGALGAAALAQLRDLLTPSSLPGGSSATVLAAPGTPTIRDLAAGGTPVDDRPAGQDASISTVSQHTVVIEAKSPTD